MDFTSVSLNALTGAAILFILTSILTCVVIFFENRHPSSTISWLLIMVFLPGVGFILYLLFGENLRKGSVKRTKRIISQFLDSEEVKQAVDMAHLEEVERNILLSNPNFSIDDKKVMKLLMNSGNTPITLNNQVDLYTEGTSKFEQMLHDLENAKDHIHMEYYIIKNSEIGNRIRDVLIRKAQEGVKVRLLYDDIGCWQLYFHPSFIRGLRKAGCEVYSYVQAKFPFLHRNFNHRNHRKICIIDGKYGYIGGINIGDEYVHKDKKFGFWRDTHLRIQGDAVHILQLVFAMDWLIRTNRKLTNRRYFPNDHEVAGSTIMQIATSGADSPHETIYQGYFYAIAQAKETVYIQTPYFIPDEPLLTALKTALLSEVDVRIMFPGTPDHFTVYNASLSYLEEVMELGAKVYFYEKGFIHSKVVLVDREIASVGTANMDIRSFVINSEVNAFIYDDETVDRLYEMFHNDLEDCREIDYLEFKQKSIIQRFIESFCRLFSALL